MRAKNSNNYIKAQTLQNSMHLHSITISADNAYWLTNLRLNKLIHEFVISTQQSRNLNGQHFEQKIRFISVLVFLAGKLFSPFHKL